MPHGSRLMALIMLGTLPRNLLSKVAMRNHSSPFQFVLPILAASSAAFLALSPTATAAPATIAAPKAPILAAKPVTAAAPAFPGLTNWSYRLIEDDLARDNGEGLTWSWKARVEATGSFESRIVMQVEDVDPKNYLMLRIAGDSKNATLRFWRVVNGQIEKFGEAEAPIGEPKGQLTIQRSGWRMRALWNGRVIVNAYSNSVEKRLGTASQGAGRLLEARFQETEPVLLRDDFQRADDPTKPEVKGAWRPVSGVWKTSGMLEPRADPTWNPNPFVYRAEAPSGGKNTTAVALAGERETWFWSDYTVMTSVRPELNTVGAPLEAGLAAYVQQDGSSVAGNVDFRSGIATIKVGGKIVATSKPFSIETDQWHRLFLDPGPGTIRFVVDGVERVRVDTSGHLDLAQGEAALQSVVGGSNHVDFDDVRIGTNDSVSDDFTTAAVGRWEDAIGEWQTRPAAGYRVKIKPGPALTLTGSASREEGVVEATFETPKPLKTAVPVGVAFAARDARNYFVARLRNNQLEVVEFTDGTGKILANTNIEKPTTTPTFVVEWREGLITARAGGTEVTATTSSLLAGRVGAWADGATGAVALGSFRALGITTGWGESKLNDKITNDRLMLYWASNAAAWRVEAGSVPMDAKPQTPAERAGTDPSQLNVYRWHTGDFFRDTTLSLPMPKFNANSTLSMLLATDPTKPGDAGASLLIERTATDYKLTLSESGTVIQTRNLPLPTGEEKRQLRFVRRLLGEGKVLLRLAVSETVKAADGEKTSTQVLFSETANAKARAKVQIINAEATKPSVISEPTKVGVRPLNIAGFDWEKVTAETGNRLDYTFTSAPVDWYASQGRWEMAERWTCTPQWGFFQGANAVNPTLWSRYGLRGDYTVEAYLATPMDHTRGERSPIDLNVTVDGDGRDLASGYSFLFAANAKRSNRIVRGDEIVVEKPFVVPPGAGNTHQDWFYVRIERRQTPQGLFFRYSVNGREVATYTDADVPADLLKTAGRIAFWSYNGPLSIARIRVWHNGVESIADSRPAQTGSLLASADMKNPIGTWQARQDGVAAMTATLQPVNDEKHKAVKITNQMSGGDWTAYVTRTPFDAAQHSKLNFSYRLPAGVLVNLYAKVDGRWREIVFSADPAQVPVPVGRWAGRGAKPAIAEAPGTPGLRLGRIEGVVADDKWHTASFDLLTPLKNDSLPTKIEALAFAAPDRGYLRTGIGGNHQGASYWISDISTSNASGAPVAIAALEK